MNKTEELLKVQSILKFPVTDIIFNTTYVELYSNKSSIGNLPFYTASGIIIYDSNEIFLNRLKWFDVYNNYKTEIDNKIIEILDITEEDIEITVGPFRNLYVKNKNGTILKTINCSFENGWNVL